MTEDDARRNLAKDVSRETLADLKTYHDLVLKWQRAINLVSATTTKQIWSRHILDSAQIFEAAPIGARAWLDLGSGAGFPGLVCAIMARADWPDLHFTLVESDARKAAFLIQVARELDLKVSVKVSRIEHLTPQNADVISARALAPLPQLLTYAVRHLSPKGICLFPKGQSHREELAAAQASWDMTYEVLPSKTSSDSVIYAIKGISHVQAT